MGSPVAADSATAVDEWDRAWVEALHFVGDPIERLTAAGDDDDSFALGSIFNGIYRLLGAARPTAPLLEADLRRARDRADTSRARDHLAALELMVVGDFGKAGTRFHDAMVEHHDFAAARYAHDVFLHVGAIDERLESSALAVGLFADSPGFHFIQGQYAFALGEAGHHDEAARVAAMAIEQDQLDLWAVHALAHVHQDRGEGDAVVDLLQGRQQIWQAQDGLAIHMWWHLTLGLIDLGRCDEALAIHDDLASEITTPFRLCDMASLLWRLELAGAAVGDRWAQLADAFAARPEQHTCGFIDLHMAMVYARVPDHPGAPRFHQTLSGTTHFGAGSETAVLFEQVVAPLAASIRQLDADPATALAGLSSIEHQLHRIGGSNAQRRVVDRTRAAGS